jgi:hypothetical protein
MFRLIPILLSAAAAIGGGVFAWAHLAGLPAEHRLCAAGFCGAGVPTVASEPTNPFGWCDLAETRGAAGDLEGARAAFEQAARLAPHTPQVLIRIVNFEVAGGDLRRAAGHIRHIQELTPAYDNVLVRYVVRAGLPLERILREYVPEPGRALAGYLIAERHPDAAATYAWVRGRGGVTPALRDQWIEYLVAVRKDFAGAQAEWAAVQREDGYPERNRIYDGRFRRERGPGRLDWVIHNDARVGVRTGDGLTVTFSGRENVGYAGISQYTWLPAGRWRFTAEAAADGLTTDERPYFRIADAFDPRRLDVATPMAPAAMTVEFTAPAGGSWVAVSLMRRQSAKFDSKIAGTLHLKEVRLGPA